MITFRFIGRIAVSIALTAYLFGCAKSPQPLDAEVRLLTKNNQWLLQARLKHELPAEAIHALEKGLPGIVLCEVKGDINIRITQEIYYSLLTRTYELRTFAPTDSFKTYIFKDRFHLDEFRLYTHFPALGDSAHPLKLAPVVPNHTPALQVRVTVRVGRLLATANNKKPEDALLPGLRWLVRCFIDKQDVFKYQTGWINPIPVTEESQ